MFPEMRVLAGEEVVLIHCGVHAVAMHGHCACVIETEFVLVERRFLAHQDLLLKICRVKSAQDVVCEFWLLKLKQVVCCAIAQAQGSEDVVLVVQPEFTARLKNELGTVVFLKNFDFGGVVYINL